MGKELFQKIESQIAEARIDGFRSAQNNSMIAIGKVLEMDTFCWQYPNIEELERTILSFPFSILWLGNPQEIYALMKRGNIEQGKLITICYDNEETEHDVNSALESCVKMRFKPGILLFTSSTSNTEFNMRSFKDFIQLIQTK